MTDNNHPITPSLELVEQWCYEDGDEIRTSPRWYQRVCAKAVRWGYEQRGAVNEAELQKARDEELEACCEWLKKGWIPAGISSDLRTARRPLSLKKQALEAAYRFYANNGHDGYNKEEIKDDFDIICRALKRLQEMEGQDDG